MKAESKREMSIPWRALNQLVKEKENIDKKDFQATGRLIECS